jgi:PAS domain S-box-containing protein
MNWVNFLVNDDSIETGISKEIFVSIMDAIDDGVFITDHEGIVLFIYNAYLRLTALKKEDLLNQPIQNLVKQGVFSRSVSMDVIKNHKKQTILQSLKDGKELLVTGHPIFKKNSNQLAAIITSVRDITVLTQAQNSQKELERRHKLDEDGMLT